MDLIYQTLLGLGAAAVGVAIIHYTGISGLIDASLNGAGDKFRAYPYRKHVLVALAVILGVVLIFSAMNVIDCVNNPMCYGWPIRAAPEAPVNLSKAVFIGGLK